MRQKAGGHSELSLEVGGRQIAEGEQIHDAKPRGIGQRRMAGSAFLEISSLNVHCLNID